MIDHDVGWPGPVVWLFVGIQVAYPVVFLGLALADGGHSAGAGALFVGVPLTAAILIGVVALLVRAARRGGIVAGSLLTAWLGFEAALWWSSSRPPKHSPAGLAQDLALGFAAANAAAAALALALTVRTARSRSSTNKEMSCPRN